MMRDYDYTYGHDKRNIAIKKLCHLVCVIFDHSPVFRIGGAAFYDPEVDKDLDSLLRRADSVMYERKKEMKATREDC